MHKCNGNLNNAAHNSREIEKSRDLIFRVGLQAGQTGPAANPVLVVDPHTTTITRAYPFECRVRVPSLIVVIHQIVRSYGTVGFCSCFIFVFPILLAELHCIGGL
jgi:hypothetical protein